MKKVCGTVIGVGDFIVDAWWEVKPTSRNVEHAAMALKSVPDDCRVSPGGAGLLMDMLANFEFICHLFSTTDVAPLTQKALVELSQRVDISGIQQLPEFCTPIKTRYVNENGHILVRHDSETSNNTNIAANIKLDDILQKVKNKHSLIVISEYAKNCISSKLISELILRARATGVSVFVDTKPHLLANCAGCNLIKINELEFNKFSAQSGWANLSIQQQLKNARIALGTSAIVVTCGAAGLWYKFKNYEPAHIDLPDIYASGNCVGAGDMFLAGLVLGFSDIGVFHPAAVTEPEFRRILLFGAAAAGLWINSRGRKLVTAQHVFKKIVDTAAAETKSAGAHILSPNDLQNFVARRRAAGHKIVFTNGCFDLLHKGHRALLQQAKHAGDTLVVGVDSDANVSRLKGPGRPIQDQETRIGNIAALHYVDAVCLFDDNAESGHNSLLELIELVAPDVLVKGADYADKYIVGANEVTKKQVNPGRILLVALVPDTSTTGLIKKMRV
jgi:D-beta-D-heptose 7-phosphate kinase/D-beta-D-heptose 1-phosphate adenosyltransferase